MAVFLPQLTESDRLDIALSKERIRRGGFRQFIVEAWPVIEPSVPFIPGFHIEAIAEHLEALFNNEIQQLLINIAPRHSKSSLVSILWHAYCWTIRPQTKWLCSSYGLNLAIDANRKCRLLISSPWYQNRYGNIFQFSGEQNKKSYFENDKLGYRMSVSVGSAATGFGGDYLIIDDMHRADDAHSDIKRDSALRWFDETWTSRLNDRHKGGLVVVGQRIHSNDITGHLLEQGGWTHLNLPTEFETSKRCRTHWFSKKSITKEWIDPRKEEGELLCEPRVNAEDVIKLKKKMGVLGYSAQYQQSPIPAGGYIFKKEWLRYYSQDDHYYYFETPEGRKAYPISDCMKFITIDLAISEKQSADYTVIATWAVTQELDLILIDIVRGHFNNPQQQELIYAAYHKHQPAYIEIETIAYQLSIYQQLRYSLPIKEYKPVKDKVTRAYSASIRMSNGKFYLKKSASWLDEYEKELLEFPKSSHDDQVDVTSHASEIAMRPRGPLVWDLSKNYEAQIASDSPVKTEEKVLVY